MSSRKKDEDSLRVVANLTGSYKDQFLQIVRDLADQGKRYNNKQIIEFLIAEVYPEWKTLKEK